MSIEQMRTRVIAAYPGPTWKDKVLAMGDNQIIRLYYKFLNEGKIAR